MVIINRIRLPIWLTITLIILASIPAQAQKLRVGAVGAPPFFIQDGSGPEGISIDIWREIAQAEDLEYELIPQKGVGAGIDAVVKGELDLVIGSISISADRLQKVAFTQPYFLVEIAVMLPSQPPTLWSKVKPLYRLALIFLVGITCLCLFVVGHLLWLTERHSNSEQFPRKYLNGAGNGMWFALVTLTSGYGDRRLVTKAGRLIAGVWMLMRMVIASSLTASLATALILWLSHQETEQFISPEDLKGSRMAVVSGTTGAKWAAYYKARLLESDTLKDAIDLLASGQADGLVFDSPALKYYLRQHPEVPLRLAKFSLATERYGFVLPLGSPLLRQLNVTILQMHQKGRIKESEDQWL